MIYFEDLISQQDIEWLLSVYSKQTKFDSQMQMGMIHDEPEVLQFIEEKINPCIDDNWDMMISRSHFYDHTYPYFPHTDHWPSMSDKKTLNFIIPLKYEQELCPHVIVFDQQYTKQATTWIFNYKFDYKSPVNEHKNCRPYDSDILNKTELPIDHNFYEKYLKDTWGDEEDYFGTSANAYEFKPTCGMAFDASHIHSTSHYTGRKVGLVVRYNYT